MEYTTLKFSPPTIFQQESYIILYLTQWLFIFTPYISCKTLSSMLTKQTFRGSKVCTWKKYMFVLYHKPISTYGKRNMD